MRKAQTSYLVPFNKTMTSWHYDDDVASILSNFHVRYRYHFKARRGADLDGKQLGPWSYAPFLTLFVTPTFFGFSCGTVILSQYSSEGWATRGIGRRKMQISARKWMQARGVV